MKDKFESTLPPGSRETRSGWVSSKEVAALLADNLANGIRIYLGRHEDDDVEYPGQLNMILVATVDKVNPDNPTTFNSVDQLNVNAVAGLVNTVSYTGMGDDRVPLCPPNCPV
ncbi:hypothetical protein ACFGVS_18650 [Mucilaginibacter sp. AW1-7]|uniref:hypothetical protein n=1 Tax=Mucilaginibacter sp. AW1-7 TaxID=3349874 RepID=UPI003F73172B